MGKKTTEEALFRAVYDQAPLGIALVDAETGCWLQVNRRYGEIVGRTPEQMVGLRFVDITHPDELQTDLEYLAQFQAGEIDSFSRDKRYLRPDGTTVWVNLTVTKLRGADGAARTNLALAQDVTARKVAEEERAQALAALAESREQLAFAIEGSGIGLWDWQIQTGALVINAIWAEMLGYTLADLTPTDASTFNRLCHPDDLAESDRRLAAYFEGRAASYECEARMRHKNGSWVWVLDRGKVTEWDGHGKPLRVTGTHLDITARKRQEEERLTLGKLESTGILAGGIAHDFNNLLAALLSYLGLAKTEAVPGGRLAEYLDEAEKVAWTARDLTREFITFSKGGAPVRKLTNLRPIIEDAVTLSLRGSAVAGDVVVAPDLWPAEVDGPQLAQVVRNLVLNARDATPGGGRILVRADNAPVAQVRNAGLPAGDFVRISVIDRGAGVPAEVLPHIFDPYFTTKPRGSERGLGLGLTICRSIAQRHGGTIAVTTEPGRGSTVEVYFPTRPAPPPPPTTPPAPAHRPVARILVMDDDEALRTVTAKVLASYGYDVEVAEDGARAVERWSQAAAARQPFDVAVLDLVVSGGMGGVATLAALRAVDPTARAVLVSGDGDDPAMHAAVRLGFAAALPRPYAADALRDALKAVLGR